MNRSPRAPPPEVAAISDFALTLERCGSETAVLRLAGELDLYRAPAIEDALAEAIGPKLARDRFRKPFLGASPAEDAQGLGEKVRRLAVDLRLVTFIDSATLVLLLGASRRQQAQGGQLRVLVGPQTPMTAFEATGLDRLLAIRRLDNEPRTGVVGTVSSERIDLSPPPHMIKGGRTMAVVETTERARTSTPRNVSGQTRLAHGDETKNALKTTEFFAMVAVNAAILIAAWVSDSLGDVRAWTLVAAVSIGYIISRGLAKSGSKYVGGEDNRNDR